jgi:hypothetical protein
MHDIVTKYRDVGSAARTTDQKRGQLADAASMVLQPLDESANDIESVSRQGFENERAGQRPATTSVAGRCAQGAGTDLFAQQEAA